MDRARHNFYQPEETLSVTVSTKNNFEKNEWFSMISIFVNQKSVIRTTKQNYTKRQKIRIFSKMKAKKNDFSSYAKKTKSQKLNLLQN